MAEEDQEKASFITAYGTYCYTTMPFGLKNTGATYQRMVNRLFKNQLGHNMEVYVDDMLIKSRTQEQFIPDLREIFDILRRSHMRLNPKKSGKFLGYMISKDGIKVNPDKGKSLFIYLAVGEETVSAVLSREGDKVQKPMYYISRAYRELKSDISGRTPLKKILSKPATSGRMVKWVVKLSKYDLDFRPQTAIKAQALADFIAEGVFFGLQNTEQTREIPEWAIPTWTLYVDGVSSKKGYGAELLFISPMGEELAYTLRFDFKASNNEFVYEALITGMEVAQNMGAESLKVYSDSQLIVNQVLGNYEIKEEPLKRYAAKVLSATRASSTCPDSGDDSLQSPWPFVQWGINLLGPFSCAPRGYKYLVVAIDYFTKWFTDNPFRNWCTELEIQQQFTSVGHSQANGKTTPQTASQETPFALTYGAETVIPAKIGLSSNKIQNFITQNNEEGMRFNLDLLEQRREEAAIRMAKYKGQITRHYNAKCLLKKLE
ncbi:uncharacterized protein [Coffea arabica]|uniref:Uncharacterized protein n=1 Tax=Coffea arabica TaxID=13443 RepID=A0ABM4UYA6_COFAR